MTQQRIFSAKRVWLAEAQFKTLIGGHRSLLFAPIIAPGKYSPPASGLLSILASSCMPGSLKRARHFPPAPPAKKDQVAMSEWKDRLAAHVLQRLEDHNWKLKAKATN